MIPAIDIPVWGRARVVILTAILVTAGLLGTRWLSRVPVRAVEVIGAEMADEAAVLELAGIPLDSTLYDLDARVIADRAARHPWVQRASVRRLPSGIVKVRVAERQPVALMIGEDGYPSYYLDAEGFGMPYRTGHPFDVPLLVGLREPFHPMGRIEHPAVRSLLLAIRHIDPHLDALTSEWHVAPDGSLRLLTVPASSGQEILVHMGREGFTEKLSRLRAYWTQAVWPRPDVRYEWIDLRFADQIVTREIT